MHKYYAMQVLETKRKKKTNKSKGHKELSDEA